MAFDRTNDATEEKRYLNRIQHTLDKLQYKLPEKEKPKSDVKILKTDVDHGKSGEEQKKSDEEEQKSNDEQKSIEDERKSEEQRSSREEDRTSREEQRASDTKSRKSEAQRKSDTSQTQRKSETKRKSEIQRKSQTQRKSDDSTKTLAEEPKEKPKKEFRTHFNANECTALALIYQKILKEEDETTNMSSESFSQILHFALEIPNSCIEQIFGALGIITHVTLEKWLEAMSLFLRGTLDEKIEYCFKIYDIGVTKGHILREHVLAMLRKCLHRQYQDTAEEALKDLVDIITKKMDKDGDGKISFEDYRATVLEDNLLLECLGHCYPKRACVYGFLATFTDRFLNY